MKILLLACLLFPICLSSQVLRGYHNSFFVINNNDTVYGLLKLRNNFPYRLYNALLFKETAGVHLQIFSPEEITGFTLGSEIYESKYIADKKE